MDSIYSHASEGLLLSPKGTQPSFATCPTSRRSAMRGGRRTSHGAAKGILASLCIGSGVCKSRRSDACLALFSLKPLVLVALCYSLRVLHFRPDFLEESHQTENLTNKPHRTSDLIRKYISLLVNGGTARASINGEHICY